MGIKTACGVLLSSWLIYYFVWDNFDPKTIADKQVLITGASSGIGEQLAYEYSRLGARVFITARRANLLKTVAEKCMDLWAKQVEFHPADMGLTEDREALILKVQERFGTLDHLILNHGILVKDWWKGSKQNMTVLLNILNVNFVSYVDLASLALPMLTEGSGNIGIVSSLAGKSSYCHYTYYSTSKFALQGFFSGLRQELLATGMDVSITLCILGIVQTPMGTFYGRINEKEKAAMYGLYDWFVESPKDTALAILRAVTNREYEMYFGIHAVISILSYKVAPFFTEYIGSMFLLATPRII